MCCVMNISPIVPISDHLLRSLIALSSVPGPPTGGWHDGCLSWPRLPSPQSLIPPLPSLISSSQPFIVKNINKCRENIDKRTVFYAGIVAFLWWEIAVRNIIFTQYLCKPNVSPVQQIRSKNKYFVFYWQTQVFDEEKVNHWIWTISCKNICFDPCSNFVVEGK